MAQENFLQLPDEPDTLHQLRIQLRRLRSMLSFSHPLMPDEVYSAFQASLQQWGNSLGPVREIDVVLEAWHEMLAGGTLQLDGTPVLADKLASKRLELAHQLHQSLAQGITTSSLLELWAWLEEYGQQALSQPEAVTVEEFSRERLAEWAQKIVRVGKKLDMDNAEALHLVRISGKKLRYVLEMLLPIWPEKARRMIEQFKVLQDGLGYLHDVYISQKITQGLLRTQSSRLMYRDTGILAGWQAHQALGVLRKIDKQWKKVRRTAEALIKKQAQGRGPGIGNRESGTKDK
jgi:CHAD domain-containing protein